MLELEQDAWTKDVAIEPLVVSNVEPGKMRIINHSPHKLTFKLRTTRVDDIKPAAGVGILPANGGMANIEVDYKPVANARPFGGNDHITVLMHECPDGVTSASEYWKSNPQGPSRFVIPLKPSSGQEPAPSTPSSASGTTTVAVANVEEESEEEESEASEGSESESEAE